MKMEEQKTYVIGKMNSVTRGGRDRTYQCFDVQESAHHNGWWQIRTSSFRRMVVAQRRSTGQQRALCVYRLLLDWTQPN